MEGSDVAVTPDLYFPASALNKLSHGGEHSQEADQVANQQEMRERTQSKVCSNTSGSVESVGKCVRKCFGKCAKCENLRRSGFQWPPSDG